MGKAQGFLELLMVSWKNHQRLLLSAYLGAGSLLIAATVASYSLSRGTLYFFGDLDNIADRPAAGIFTLISGFCLAAAGGLLLQIPSQLPAAAGREAMGWRAAALGFVFLGVDEVMMLHEQAAWALRDLGVPRAFGVIDQDLYVFGFYALGAVAIAWRLWPSILRHQGAIFPFVAMILFFAASQAVDFVPWDALTHDQQGVLGPLEEILKTLGSWSAALYSALTLRSVISER